ncbi:MAG: hypothetical protein NC037_05045 [Bacteroides sp.]|nr:hypothetical protein [Bacillota bacterium]MCM1394441.1 hypothetical protein [[Eubacterium] siraeum]MCM1455872.1 hypothetical protein [Bacteroides sp.]
MFNALFAAKAPGTTTPLNLEEVMQDPKQLKWYIVPIFVITLYLIISEIRKKNYSTVFGAAAFWLMDVFNETWNAMVYATTGQPVWGTTAAGGSALQILVGYNIEISFMFFILGMMTCKLLTVSDGFESVKFMDGNKNWLNDPRNMYYKANVKHADLTVEERKIKLKAVLGRVITAVVGSVLAVIIEILLNKCGVLTWEKDWWQPSMPLVLFLIGYCPFFFAAVCIHDLPRKWQIIGVGIILAVVVLLLIISGSLGMLGPQTDGAGNWIGKFYTP